MDGIPKISSLHETLKKKQNLSNTIFKTVLMKCGEKILYTNKYTKKSYTICDIPEFLIGEPSYKRESCIHYIMNELSGRGYYVNFIEPKYIYIDWGNNNRNNFTNVTSEELLKHFPKLKNIEYHYQ